MRSTAMLLATVTALLGHAACATEQVMSAQDLQQLCSDTDHVSVNVCRVYILGVAQGIELGLNIADRRTPAARACVPQSLAGEDLELTLKRKLAQHLAAFPAHGTRDAAAVLATLLAGAFPCSKPAAR